MRKKAGFTLLFSVLVASILLAIGIAIFNLTLKELLLSAAGRESQFAIYSADTGIECALYWDLVRNSFPTSSASQVLSSGVSCNTQDIAAQPWTVVSSATRATTTFTLLFTPEQYCAVVEVGKHANPARTIVISRGYNSCDTGNPRRVERILRATY